MAATGIALCLIVAGPFIPGLAWALAFAVVTHPIHRWISSRIRRPDIAAGLSVAIVAVMLILPTILVGWRVGSQAAEGLQKVDELQSSDVWRQKLRGSRAGSALSWILDNFDVKKELGNITDSIQQRAGRWMRSFVWGVVQIAIALFALFYFFRDKRDVLRVLRSLMPMSDRETDEFFDRIRAMTHATIYGTLVVAAIQGALGGLMFAMLGIPGALVWGVIMGLLAIIPTLGAFVIWAPAAVMLAAQGHVGKALMLAGWGTLVVGLIDNLLYPMLVGKEMRLHTLPVFVAIVGGLFVFGAAGLVLGPVILAATVALVEILRKRTAHGRSADQPT
jgi:predicted PurR-regulated permease PerM